MTTIAITGLPGSGKTHLATALSLALQARGDASLLLHTDLLKVTLRQFDLPLTGPTYRGDIAAKLAAVRPYLEAQVAKAQRDRYYLVIEGTLALGFQPASGGSVCLELPAAERQRRIASKPIAARASLATSDLTAYAQLLRQQTPVAALRLDAMQPVAAQVQAILSAIAPA
ncbi:MAG: adenylyl-sulfate kinase [Spirulinaceae cyanobacterium RM2_2_10]|nr:adenylyl-sulfate kinase [Spirulinaceae cyanobacterium SM2_1_0]NJO19096.1 adenylyl-sulfate kinase [Spirulinaceae cyanobacterium RM2_2_10]